MPFSPVWPHLFPLPGDHAGLRAVGEPRFCGSISVFPRYRAAPTSQRAPGREAAVSGRPVRYFSDFSPSAAWVSSARLGASSTVTTSQSPALMASTARLARLR